MKPPGTVQVSRGGSWGSGGTRASPEGWCGAGYVSRAPPAQARADDPVTLSTVCLLGWPGPSSPQGPLGTRFSTKPNLQSRVPRTLRTLHSHPRVAITPEPRHVLSSGG